MALTSRRRAPPETAPRFQAGWRWIASAGSAAHAGDGNGAGGDLRLAAGELACVADRFPGHRRDADPDLEFLLEEQRAMEIARCRDAGPVDVAAGRRDAQAGFAPERVLGLLHVAEIPAEVHDARASVS
jgi:hypothetical protein